MYNCTYHVQLYISCTIYRGMYIYTWAVIRLVYPCLHGLHYLHSRILVEHFLELMMTDGSCLNWLQNRSTETTQRDRCTTQTSSSEFCECSVEVCRKWNGQETSALYCLIQCELIASAPMIDSCSFIKAYMTFIRLYGSGLIQNGIHHPVDKCLLISDSSRHLFCTNSSYLENMVNLNFVVNLLFRRQN